MLRFSKKPKISFCRYYSNFDKNELNKFDKFAQNFRDPNGSMKMLHKMNPVRTKFIRNIAISHYKIDKNEPFPLQNKLVLDVGCGGGLLSEVSKTFTTIFVDLKNRVAINSPWRD
ncbi:hypothetical protein MHBO_004882 [Bonamia ostreae]|uniref:Uncharacterized protein n=1 Tax=Bonamia ostreae TaxID=126728 RepID=A0ABV2AUJ4_9EUKA